MNIAILLTDAASPLQHVSFYVRNQVYRGCYLAYMNAKAKTAVRPIFRAVDVLISQI